MHTRIRKFNTRDTYPEQKLDNDLCQASWHVDEPCSSGDRSDRISTAR